MLSENGELKPFLGIEYKTTLVVCPNCNDPNAMKSVWKYKDFIYTSIQCNKCNYSKDESFTAPKN